MELISVEQKIIPKYVPYPTTYAAKGINTEAQVPPRTAIFKVTGGTYFWQFSFFDGAEEGVYFKPDSTETIAPKFSPTIDFILSLQMV